MKTLNNPDTNRLAKGSSGIFLGRIVAQSVRMTTQIALARILGPANFGLYTIGWVLAMLVGPISLLGLPQGVIYYGAKYQKFNHARLKSIIRQSLGFGLLSGLFFGFVVYITAPWVAVTIFREPDAVDIIRWFAPAIIVFSGLRIASAITRIRKQVRYTVYANDLTQSIAHLVLLLGFHLIGWHLFGMVLASVMSFGAGFLLALFYVRRMFSSTLEAESDSSLVIFSMLKFSLPTLFSGMLGRLNMRIDRLFIGHFCTKVELGIYQAVAQPILLFPMILSTFVTIATPLIADLHHQREVGRMAEIVKVSTKWSLYMSLPVLLMIIVRSSELITFLFGVGYVHGQNVLVILAIAQIINVGTGPLSALLIMTGNQASEVSISSCTLVTNVILNIVLIPKLGFVGAAIATVCATVVRLGLQLYRVNRLFGIWPYDRRYLKGFTATVFTIFALYVYNKANIGYSLLVDLPMVFVISVLTFFGALTLIGLDSEDRVYIHWFRKRLKI